MNKSKTEGKLVKVLAIGLLELCVFTAQAEDGRCRPLDLKCKVVTGAREERNSYNEAKAVRAAADKALKEQVKEQDSTCKQASRLRSWGVPDSWNLAADNCDMERRQTQAREAEYANAKREEALRKQQYQDARKNKGAWR